MSLDMYIRDKRYFAMGYVGVMLFVSLMMWLGMEREQAAGHIVYANGVCFVLTALYIIIGYYYRRAFYEKLKMAIERDELYVPLPDPQNTEQRLWLELVGRLQQSQIRRLDQAAAEKREHQDYILSWIHEVKLPIAASRLLLENSPGKSVEYLVDKLEDELGRVDHYVEQALYASRVDSFSKDYLISEVLLGSIVKESVKKYAKMFINKKIQVRLVEGEPQVFSDSKWLAYIIDQIIANALKYTPEGGEITVQYEEDMEEKRLIIRDTGIGIPLEDIGRVFDKGFTGSIGRTHAKSTGMGLYLAKQLALKLGHDLSVRSELGEYTEMRVHFPKIRDYTKI